MKYEYEVIPLEYDGEGNPTELNILRHGEGTIEYIYLNEADTKKYYQLKVDYKNFIDDIIGFIGFKEEDWKR